jgi:hypothetical protein
VIDDGDANAPPPAAAVVVPVVVAAAVVVVLVRLESSTSGSITDCTSTAAPLLVASF